MNKKLKWVYVGGIVLLIGICVFVVNWRIPVRVLASKDDPLIDPIFKPLLDSGFKIIYHKKRTDSNDWMLDGSFDVFDKDGRKMLEYIYKDGVWHGPMTSWYKNGKISSKVIYKNGKESGMAMFVDEKGGLIREVQYVDGLQNGKETYWDLAGKVVMICDWIKGRPIKVVVNRNGQKIVYMGKEAEEYLIQRGGKNLSLLGTP